jgi:hypothetical protein
MGKLLVSITGLNQFSISFEEYCIPCEYQSRCKYGKKNPFSVAIECKNLSEAVAARRQEAFMKAQKNAKAGETFEEIEKKIKVNTSTIFSELWDTRVKALKEEILCLNPKKLDPMITTTQGSEWWADFREAMQEVFDKCKDAM